jgi:hypothetical protein
MLSDATVYFPGLSTLSEHSLALAPPRLTQGCPITSCSLLGVLDVMQSLGVEVEHQCDTAVLAQILFLPCHQLWKLWDQRCQTQVLQD